jgi:hypothetical protein
VPAESSSSRPPVVTVKGLELRVNEVVHLRGRWEFNSQYRNYQFRWVSWRALAVCYAQNICSVLAMLTHLLNCWEFTYMSSAGPSGQCLLSVCS